MSGKSILVYAHWETMAKASFMGTLLATPARGKAIFSFEYNKNWLSAPYAQNIDPDTTIRWSSILS